MDKKLFGLEGELNISKDGSKYGIVVNEGTQGYSIGKFKFFSKPKQIRVIGLDVKNDLEFSLEIETKLREKFGYGSFSKVFDDRTKSFEGIYCPLEEFEPKDLIKSISISGKSEVIHTHVYKNEPSKRREVYSSPGKN